MFAKENVVRMWSVLYLLKHQAWPAWPSVGAKKSMLKASSALVRAVGLEPTVGEPTRS